MSTWVAQQIFLACLHFLAECNPNECRLQTIYISPASVHLTGWSAKKKKTAQLCKLYKLDHKFVTEYLNSISLLLRENKSQALMINERLPDIFT